MVRAAASTSHLVNSAFISSVLPSNGPLGYSIALPRSSAAISFPRIIVSKRKHFFASLRLCVFALNCYGHACVTQAGPRQAVERRHVFRHLVEQTFDGQETVLAGDVVNQIVQTLP